MCNSIRKGDYENYFIEDIDKNGNKLKNIDYFENIFERHFNKKVTHVQLVDPYLNRAIHQYMFYKLCLTLSRSCSLEKLEVYTNGTGKNKVESFLWRQTNAKWTLRQVYTKIFDTVFPTGSHKYMLHFRDGSNRLELHDRSITFNNGRFIMGRGLEMYHGWCKCTHKQHLSNASANVCRGRMPVESLDVKDLFSRQHEITFLQFQENDFKTFWLHSLDPFNL